MTRWSPMPTGRRSRRRSSTRTTSSTTRTPRTISPTRTKASLGRRHPSPGGCRCPPRCVVEQNQPLLLMEAITKTFPGVVALRGASLRVGHGEVHALVGQNGAGKSTLIKIMTGAYRRDAGSILFDGRPVDFQSPFQAQAAGVSTIYQEGNLIPFRSVS